VVLAAGQGRRFGGAKLMAPLRGRPVLAHVCAGVALAREAGLIGPGWAVTAAGDQAAASIARWAGLEVVPNDRTDEGVSTSIRLGLRAAAEGEAGAVLLLLGDQPLVRVDTMRRLVEAWRAGGGPVVRPRYLDLPDTPGHPVLLDRAVWPLAERATGDTGLAGLLPPPLLVDVSGANPDVDTRADLHLLKEPPP
jgi:CTP:molybdopterin cytidylyltransferase MocA